MASEVISRAAYACEGLPSTRAEARALGASRYFTGLPCKNGHVAVRKVTGSLCLACHKAHIHRWRQANADRVNTLQRDRENADRAAHRKRKREEKKAWRIAQPDKAKAANWVTNRARYARRRKAEGRYTAEDIARIRAAQKDRCAYCRVSLVGAGHPDHIIALANGGKNWPSNIQLLCIPCNTSKRHSDPIDFMQRRGMLL